MRLTDDISARLRSVRLLAMDVDGVLTDGRLAYDERGGGLKLFHVADGMGLAILCFADIDTAWISGRTSSAVFNRAADLHITHVQQGVRDKGSALRALAGQCGISREAIAFVGDDWNDLTAFEESGVCIAVKDAVAELRQAADLVTDRPGGHGAVREVCEALLEALGLRQIVLERYLKSLKDARLNGPIGQ